MRSFLILGSVILLLLISCFEIHSHYASASSESLASESQPVVVAIVDSGIDLDHPSLADLMIPGYNFLDPDEAPEDDNGHGTHMAGIVASAFPDNSELRLMPLKVLDRFGQGRVDDISKAIRWAVDGGADIINVSIGRPKQVNKRDGTVVSNYDQREAEAIAYAYAHGVLVVAAAGDGSNRWLDRDKRDLKRLLLDPHHIKIEDVYYPAALPHVIAVGAVQEADEGEAFAADFSNGGSELDFVAPGVRIESAYIGGGKLSLSGTSQATAMVTAVLAELLAEKPGMTPDEAEQALKRQALDVGEPDRDPIFGFGMIAR